MAQQNYSNAFNRAETTSEIIAAFTKYGLEAEAHSSEVADKLTVTIPHMTRFTTNDVANLAKLVGYTFGGNHIDEKERMEVTLVKADDAWWL